MKQNRKTYNEKQEALYPATSMVSFSKGEEYE